LAATWGAFGWGTRVVFIFGIALAPVAGAFLSPACSTGGDPVSVVWVQSVARHFERRLVAVDTAEDTQSPSSPFS
jgi:hypothetical protein